MKMEIDVTEIEQYKERLHIALKAAKICVFEVDLIHQLYTFFENAEDIFGIPGKVILEDIQPFSKLEPQEYQKAVSAYFSHPEDAGVIDEAFRRIFEGKPATYQARMKAGGSEFIWCKIDVTPILENEIPVKMIGVITDITDIKMKTDSLEKEIQLDSFTKLYNKTMAEELIHRTLQEKTTQQHALILLDIDDFKMLNDTFGHSEGDKVIQAVAEILQKSFRKSDIIGKFGGDEFILLIQNIPNRNFLIPKLKELVRHKVGHLEITNSLGVAIYPKDGNDFSRLFERADKALYRAKEAKSTFKFCSEVDF